MLKLGGWPRLTWGIGPKMPHSGDAAIAGSSFGVQPRPSAGMGLGVTRAVAHHSPLPAPYDGPTLGPTAPRGSEGQDPHRENPSVDGLLTPMRQACPREGPSGATCVQRLDGSRDSAIHTTYRISLRSSSMREPRYPLPRVILRSFASAAGETRTRSASRLSKSSFPWRQPAPCSAPDPNARRARGQGRWAEAAAPPRHHVSVTCAPVVSSEANDNDPSAGSPTETLLRLLLPLNDKVQWTSRDVTSSEPPASPRSEHFTGPFNR